MKRLLVSASLVAAAVPGPPAANAACVSAPPPRVSSGSCCDTTSVHARCADGLLGIDLPVVDALICVLVGLEPSGVLEC